MEIWEEIETQWGITEKRLEKEMAEEEELITASILPVKSPNTVLQGGEIYKYFISIYNELHFEKHLRYPLILDDFKSWIDEFMPKSITYSVLHDFVGDIVDNCSCASDILQKITKRFEK